MYFYDTVKNEWISVRDTAEYKKRRKIVRDGWLFVATLMLATPLHLTVVLALLATFLSFMFLDEVEYQFMVSLERRK